MDVLENRIFTLLAEIATCLCAQIEENELPGLCFCGILPGDQPYDVSGIGDECGGQAWVRLVNAYPSTQVGVADITVGNCTKGLGFDLEVGIIRSIVIPEDGEAMEPEELLSGSQLQIADMLTMQQALQCCEALANEDFVLGTYLPSGPDGALLGGVWPASVLVV